MSVACLDDDAPFRPSELLKKYDRLPGFGLKSLTNPGNITMGRPKGSKNRRTILKEAEQHVGAKYVGQVLDSLYVLESASRLISVRPNPRADFIGMAAATPGEKTLAVIRCAPL
jgi:hypothetical protein